MSVENPNLSSEQPVNPIQAARTAFNKSLFNPEYSGPALINRTAQLQNTLLGSDLGLEKIYHELAIVSGQAADRADAQQDEETASTLRTLQTGYELTYKVFQPNIGRAALTRPTEPTKTESLPPMTSPKSEAAPRAVRKAPVRPAAEPASPEPVSTPEPEANSEPEASSESEVASPESNTESQNPPKRRGRPPKNPQQ